MRKIISAWATRQKSIFRHFLLSSSGSAGIEYGIIIALVSVLIAVSLALVSGNLNSMFNLLVTAFS
ncbi:MAG: Flp family type IVb pilin [Alphaproteobacteria bacterium]|nr:Flp family type IVb pilin [Alphaproteobacteria bacterium]